MDREHLGNLAAFAIIAEERNFTRAAARLGVSASALSHAMRGLEERLHVRLLSRSTRSVSTTEAGERLLAKLRPALSDIDAALQDLEGQRERPAGRVRVVTSRLPATMFIAPALPKFAIDYPDVAVELIIDEGLTDIVAQRFDAGIRLGESVAKDMISVRISPDQLPAVVAAPGYLEKHGVPQTPHDLRGHRCIGYWMNTAGIVYKWEFEKGDQKLDVAIDTALVFNDADMMVNAALAGLGLTYAFDEQVKPHLQAGTLVRVLDDWCVPFPGYFLYYPSRRQTPAALLALINALRVQIPALSTTSGGIKMRVRP
jgi:DNA-binding transcriptional LysR family regulator